jgi:hypothetical protein
LLLKADGFEIKDSFIKESLGQLAPEVQKDLEKTCFFFWTRKPWKNSSCRMRNPWAFATEPPNEQMFQAYIDRVTKGVTVPERRRQDFL